MTNGINNVSGYGNYGLGGYVPRRNDEGTPNEATQAPVQDAEATQVDPAKVMDFLAANNFYIAQVDKTPTGEIDDATRARIESSMENFEIFYAAFRDEFGDKLAPQVMNIAMDMAMDILMGMAT